MVQKPQVLSGLANVRGESVTAAGVPKSAGPRGLSSGGSTELCGCSWRLCGVWASVPGSEADVSAVTERRPIPLSTRGSHVLELFLEICFISFPTGDETGSICAMTIQNKKIF